MNSPPAFSMPGTSLITGGRRPAVLGKNVNQENGSVVSTAISLSSKNSKKVPSDFVQASASSFAFASASFEASLRFQASVTSSRTSTSLGNSRSSSSTRTTR